VGKAARGDQGLSDVARVEGVPEALEVVTLRIHERMFDASPDDGEPPTTCITVSPVATPERTAEGRGWLRSRRTAEVLAALTCAAGVLALAAYGGWWPFDESLTPAGSYRDPSIWQYLLSDPTTLGFVRLGIIALALFIIASVPALIIAGRWMKGLGTGGISADDAASARVSIEELQGRIRVLTADLERVRRERDRAREIARESVTALEEAVRRREEGGGEERS
jgi:hypothetical protein